MLVVLVPVIPVAVATLLIAMGWLEDRLVSPKALIRAGVRKSTPERAELLVAQEAARLLG